MKQKFNKILPKSEFSRNVLTLMTGTTIAQAIPIAISPILTRIYTPEDFGVLALFVAMTSIFSSIANGRYELAVMLPEKDEDAINIFALGLLIVSILSIVLLLLVIFFNHIIVSLLENDKIGFWLYFVPIIVFFMGLFNMLNYFNNRKKYYKDIAKATIIKSIVLAMIQLVVGFFKSGATGLITGRIFSQFFANMRLANNILKDKALISKITKIRIIALAKRYKRFPQFSMWAALSNTMTYQFTNMLISIYFSVQTLGFYSMVQKILGMPSTLVGNSIGQVFFQEATKEKQTKGNAIEVFDKTIRKLLKISLPLFLILFFTIEDLFAFIFGAEWEIAGKYAQIIIPLYFIRFVVAVVTVANSIFEKQNISFYWQLSLLFFSILTIVISHILKIEFLYFLYFFTSVMFIHYLVLYVLLRKVVSLKM